jgi:hypothetical protein
MKKFMRRAKWRVGISGCGPLGSATGDLAN